MRENTDQKNSEYEHFPRSEAVIEIIVKSELNRITDTNSKLNMIKQKTYMILCACYRKKFCEGFPVSETCKTVLPLFFDLILVEVQVYR